MILWDMETASEEKWVKNQFGSLLNNNRVNIYKNWHHSKSAQDKNRKLTYMQTKLSGIIINDYNLPRTTRKSVKINITSASLLCNLCFFYTLKTGQNNRKIVHFAVSYLQHSCALISGKFEIFLRGRTPTLQKIDNFFKSRTRLAFCKKPVRTDLAVGGS